MIDWIVKIRVPEIFALKKFIKRAIKINLCAPFLLSVFFSFIWLSGLERTRKQKVGCSNHSSDRTKTLKLVVTATLTNVRQ